MPLPGLSFLAAAVQLGDPDVIIDGSKKTDKRLTTSGPNLDMLYTYALYEPWFTLNILVKNKSVPCRFIPGHIWGATIADGPRQQADVMIIGKMPGKEESDKSLLLTGPAGRLTKQILFELGVTYEEQATWYVTNVLKFPHPNPLNSKAIASSWIKDCAILLEQELRLVKPKYILCFGNEAAKALLGMSGKITQSANKVHDYKIITSIENGNKTCEACYGTRVEAIAELNEDGDDVLVPCKTCFGSGLLPVDLEYHTCKVFTTIHPNNCIRDPSQVNQLRTSIKLFVDLIRGEKMDDDELDYHIIDNEQDLKAEVDKLIARTPTGSIIAVDGEWHSNHAADPGAYMRTVQVSDRAGYALCVELHAAGGAEAFKPNVKAAIPHLRRLLKTSDKRIVRIAGHFFRADYPWIKHHLDIDLMPEHMAPADDGTDTAHFRTAFEGGMDTGLMAHAVDECGQFKLELLGTRYTKLARYDSEVQKWRATYCAEHGITKDLLDGYGLIPREILFAEGMQYALKDADLTRRLVDVFNGIWSKPWEVETPGLLDNDGSFLDPRTNTIGLNCRKSFWTAHRATPAAAEMEFWGIKLDVDRAEHMIRVYTAKRNELVAQLRKDINWPTFKVSSTPQCRELLFGIGYSRAIDKVTKDENKQVSPEGAILLNLKPIKATGKENKKSWDQLVREGNASKFTPATDKETLGILANQSPVARSVRNIRFITQVLNTVLKHPAKETIVTNKELLVEGKKKPRIIRTKELIDKVDEDGEPVYDKGLLHYVSKHDGRVRTSLYQTLDTGRWSSSRPNLQAISKRREDDYKRILGDKYPGPIRTVFIASPGYVLIEADILGAELAVMAWDSGDAKMAEHVRRNLLSEDDPDFYDIHSNVAVSAFRLTVPNQQSADKLNLKIGDPCPANKHALSTCGYKALRVAAKNVMFGYAYGRGAEAISRQCKEEGAAVSVEQAQQLINGLVSMYPGLRPFFDKAKARVEWPGWQCSDFGYYRRTVGSEDKTVRSELERKFMNFRVQNAVAGAISRGLDHLILYREQHAAEVDYRLLMQIHDAVLLEVPYKYVEKVYDEVLPYCMVKQVPVWPCDFNGDKLIWVTKPNYFGIDRQVMLRWGADITKEECRTVGISERFGVTNDH